MISFYPGPSRVYDEVPGYVKKAHAKGILSMNHRSEDFMALYRETVALLKKKQKVPKTYTVLFASSATECWEIIAQSLVEKQSAHFYSGAFGEKWFQYTQKLKPAAQPVSFHLEFNLPVQTIASADVICLTQNETSNGTQVDTALIAQVKKKNPHALVAVDATSSMAGIVLPFTSADVWFASVQKCFGLPAGLAILILSPKTIERVAVQKELAHYNSLAFMKQMADQWQTNCTPNVLGIYLLRCVLKQQPSIEETSEQTKERYQAWADFFGASKKLRLLVANEAVRSHTVVTVTGDPAYLAKVKKHARKEGFLLGEGYGALKSNTFRIANFPALQEREIKKLKKFLAQYL